MSIRTSVIAGLAQPPEAANVTVEATSIPSDDIPSESIAAPVVIEQPAIATLVGDTNTCDLEFVVVDADWRALSAAPLSPAMAKLVPLRADQYPRTCSVEYIQEVGRTVISVCRDLTSCV